MVAETNPNHTSMITGAYPRRHGITGNEFAVYGPTKDEDSCSTGPFDTAAAPVATSGEQRGCPRVENVFAAIERQPGADQLTTALVMGKPKLARLFSTQRVTPGDYDADYIWAPCDDGEDYCEDVPTNPVTGYAVDDRIVMDEVIETTRDGVGARRRRIPDFTFANFPQIDSAGHAFGRSSLPYSLAIGDGRHGDRPLRRQSEASSASGSRP